jgi:Skp family chaperone for outer membrane proteins
MKTISSAAACILFAVIFAVSASAQTATPAAGKIGLVNINAFAADTGGIGKFKAALTALDNEFKPVNDGLRTKATRYQTLGAEIEKLRTPAAAGVPAQSNAATLQAKVDEARNLETQIKRDQEDAKAKYDQRYSVVIGPVFNDILKAMNEYAKSKGYAVVLDGAKLEESGILLGFDDKYDITKDFITFYNARPAGAATASVPK